MVRKCGKFLERQQVAPGSVDGFYDCSRLKLRDAVLFVPCGPSFRPCITKVPWAIRVFLLHEDCTSAFSGRIINGDRGPSKIERLEDQSIAQGQFEG